MAGTPVQKPVEELEKDECFAELKELDKVVEFDRTWSKRTSVAELRELVRQGREALLDDDEDEDEDDDDDEDDIDLDDENETPKEKGVAVYDGRENYVRTYTQKRHGKDYQKLAKQFVSKPGRENYTLKEVK